ncbi:hypothetical protein [Micromonospora echinospora]|uniref:hypothetical protein n=1 Tax=Micromonospora echinospora TaxID=1877 RepID=UPI003A83BBD6
MTRYRYTPQARARNVTEVMRLLGVRISGGSHAHISRQLKRFGIDTSHFTGRASGTRVPRAPEVDRTIVVRHALANPDLGPRKLADLIRVATAGREHPSHGTVSNVLRAAGLHTVQARRTRLSGQAGVV